MTGYPFRLTAFAALMACASTEAGLVDPLATLTRRHDDTDQLPNDPQSDAAYVALAASFPSVGLLNGASGTLIAPDWVLTAAHVVNAGSPAANSFTIGGQTYTGSSVAVAPGWNGSLFAGNDIAVLRLSSPVTNVSPVGYNASGGEVGRVGTFAGFGLTGTGLTGPTGGGGTKRAGRNMLDVTADAFNEPTTPPAQTFSDRILATDFDTPDVTSPDATRDYNIGSYTPLDLEFNAAGGDSGGGLFIDFGAGWLLAGVATFTAHADGTQNSDYGDFSGFTRTSSWASWIQSQTQVAPAAVPEPSSAVMLLCAAGAAAALRLRRGRRAG